MFDFNSCIASGKSGRRIIGGVFCNAAFSFLISAMIFPFCSANGGELLAADSKDSDEKTIRAQADDYSKAFASGDVAALTAMWADDAVFTDQVGLVYNGRAAIQKQMSSFFDKYGKQPFQIKIDSLEFPADNLAFEHGTTHIGTSSNPMSYGVYSATHIKRDGKWLMIAVSEYPKLPDPQNSNIADLAWLIGTWKVEGPRGNLQIKADWVADKKIIRCDFDVDSKDGKKSTQTQFIFVDPLFKRIRSWQYDWSGGYGESRWFNSNGNWISQGCAVEADGTTGSARYVIKKLDDNTFSWQSTARRLQGKALPDTPVLTAKRVSS